MAAYDAIGKDPVRSAPSPRPGTPTSEEVRAQLERVLHSPGFVHAPRRQQFLIFVVEEVLAGRGDLLKEFVVASEVFGRRDTYDPAVDATVRVEARRVRERLEHYYSDGGAHDPVRLHLPLGTYTPTWERQEDLEPLEAPRETGAAAVPETHSDSQRPDRGARVARHPRPTVVLTVALLVTIVAGALFLSMAPLPGNRSSLVVLPFVALDEDPASVYLANGLYEDLTAELGRVGGLTVIGKTSAARLRRQGVDAAEVGRQLRVPAVLDGSVRRDDGRVRITARLVESGTGRQLWAESFDRPWRAILDIQRDVASAVAIALPRDRGPWSAPAVSRVTDDPEAWDAYLQARYMRDRHSQEGLEASVPLFERAVTLDPSYGGAWTGLGEALTMLAFHGLMPKDTAIPRARMALDRAIVLEPQSAEAHAARAWLALVHDWQWTEAERGFRLALAIAPGLARARQCYAFGLASRRRFDEALAQSRQAMALDPHSYAASNDLSVLLLFARRYDEAISQARDTLTLDPSLSIAHVNIGSALLGKGLPAEALKEFDRGMDTARFSTVLGRAGYAYAMLGREHDARAVLLRIHDTFGATDASPMERAYVYAGVGDRHATLAAIQQAVASHDGEAIFIDVQPFFDNLRGDPAFESLRARVGLTRR